MTCLLITHRATLKSPRKSLTKSYAPDKDHYEPRCFLCYYAVFYVTTLFSMLLRGLLRFVTLFSMLLRGFTHNYPPKHTT